MKKALFLLLSALICILMLAACDGGSGGNETATTAAGAETTAAATETEPAETTAAGPDYSEKTLKLSDTVDKVKINGRYSVVGDGISCDWSAAGIEFCADCEGDISFEIDITQKDFFTVFIDDERMAERLAVNTGSGSYKLATGLSRGQHTVLIEKQEQASTSLAVIKTLTLCGELCDKPQNRELYIEFIGTV